LPGKCQAQFGEILLGNGMQTLRPASICLAIQLLIDTYLKDICRQNVRKYCVNGWFKYYCTC